MSVFLAIVHSQLKKQNAKCRADERAHEKHEHQRYADVLVYLLRRYPLAVAVHERGEGRGRGQKQRDVHENADADAHHGVAGPGHGRIGADERHQQQRDDHVGKDIRQHELHGAGQQDEQHGVWRRAEDGLEERLEKRLYPRGLIRYGRGHQQREGEQHHRRPGYAVFHLNGEVYLGLSRVLCGEEASQAQQKHAYSRISHRFQQSYPRHGLGQDPGREEQYEEEPQQQEYLLLIRVYPRLALIDIAAAAYGADVRLEQEAAQEQIGDDYGVAQADRKDRKQREVKGPAA